MHYKVIVFLILVKTLLTTIVNCEETSYKDGAKDLNNMVQVRHRRSPHFSDTFRFMPGMTPSPTSSSPFLFRPLSPVDNPFSPPFRPNRHRYRQPGHHQGHGNYGKTFWDVITTTTEEPKGHITDKDRINAVTEADNISSETTMGVYISSAERNANNRNIFTDSNKKTDIKNDDSTEIKVDVRFQPEQSNYRTFITNTTDQAEIASTTTEGFKSTSSGTSPSSDDFGNSTENVPVPDNAGRHIVKVPRRCHTDKNGNCRKMW
ncbi:uncharacterized protein LOC108736062 [Agrilus planipennis]|uniref:Uncharacterized protein LOC108736062 n=1 Tax=Agrilus planipennis TaxID=224129 RepID=A0A1W4WIT8_AGRPL|nr:uncharacterized protein LOC108736062 [Agrilus planipennis]